MPDNPNALRDGALTVAGLYAAVAVAGLTANHWLPTVAKQLPPPSALPLTEAPKR